MQSSGEVGTFFLVKPDALRRGLAAPIVARLESSGFVIASRALVRLRAADVEELYGPHTFSKFTGDRLEMIRRNTLAYLGEAECLYLPATMRGEGDVFRRSNDLKGVHYAPERCPPGSIRRDFRDAIMTSDVFLCGMEALVIPMIDRVVPNLIHCPAHVAERDHQEDVLRRLLRADLAPAGDGPP